VTDDARTLVAAYADRLEQRDWTGFAELLAEDVVYEIPQTRERIRGRDRYVRFNVEYPGDWHLVPEVIVGDDRRASMLARFTVGDETMPAIAFFEVADGVITRITDFWPEPYDPPPGREHLVERD
jgi:ketosteroid isomerase-like protein